MTYFPRHYRYRHIEVTITPAVFADDYIVELRDSIWGVRKFRLDMIGKRPDPFTKWDAERIDARVDVVIDKMIEQEVEQVARIR